MSKSPVIPIGENKRIRLLVKELLDKKMEREKRDISYRELADSANVSLRTAFRMCKGEWARLDVLEKLCDYFDCDPGELLVRE